MSAPNQEEWRVSATEAWRSRSSAEAVISLCDAVARRRALAELRALAMRSCVFCAKGDSPVAVGFGVWIHSYGGPHVDCQCQKIHDRIAEIEAEEG